MRDFSEFEKIKQEIDAGIPSRLDTTLDRCMARATYERRPKRILKMSKAIAFSIAGILSVSGITFASVTGGFERMFGNSYETAEIYSEYISQEVTTAKVGDFEICVEKAMEDKENKSGVLYCSITNTNPDSDYILYLYTSGEDTQFYKNNDHASKYVSMCLTTAGSCMYIDDAASTADKKYVLLSYFGYNVEGYENVLPQLALVNCNEFGDGIIGDENPYLGTVDIPYVTPVEKHKFTAADGSVVELSPISIKYDHFNLTKMQDEILKRESPDFGLDIWHALMNRTKLVTASGKETNALDIGHEFLWYSDSYDETTLNDVYLIKMLTKIYDSDSVEKIIVDGVEYKSAETATKAK